MTDQIREQLSALLDGELPKDEMGLLVRRLEKDAALRRAFGSYALIGETLRAPGGRIATTGFAARVSATIDATEATAVQAKASHDLQRTLGPSRRPVSPARPHRPKRRSGGGR